MLLPYLGSWYLITVLVQGAIAIGNQADIVVWEPDLEFDLDNDYPVHVKHPVCILAPIISMKLVIQVVPF